MDYEPRHPKPAKHRKRRFPPVKVTPSQGFVAISPILSEVTIHAQNHPFYPRNNPRKRSENTPESS